MQASVGTEMAAIPGAQPAVFLLQQPQEDAAAEPEREMKWRLNAEFAAIALPALAQFAAEPIAGLVDTA